MNVSVDKSNNEIRSRVNRKTKQTNKHLNLKFSIESQKNLRRHLKICRISLSQEFVFFGICNCYLYDSLKKSLYHEEPSSFPSSIKYEDFVPFCCLFFGRCSPAFESLTVPSCHSSLHSFHDYFCISLYVPLKYS